MPFFEKEVLRHVQGFTLQMTSYDMQNKKKALRNVECFYITYGSKMRRVCLILDRRHITSNFNKYDDNTLQNMLFRPSKLMYYRF